DCTNWRRDFAAVLAAMRESRRLADASLAEIREAVAGASGRQRLQRAIQVRRYRNAEGDDIVTLAAAIIDEIESGGSLSAVSVEVADLGLLVEKLVGETNRDELVDLKDNRLVPTFARLRRELSKAEHRGTDFGIDEELVNQFETTLYGVGFVNDLDHQTLELGIGGLYAVSSDRLELLGLQTELRTRVDHAFASVRQTQDGLQMDTERLWSDLSEEAHASLWSTWRMIIFVSPLVCVLFLVIAARVARLIHDQVAVLGETNDALEQASEEALAASKAKSEFLSNMSHELRTPLNGVLGYAQILQRDAGMTEQQRESLASIENCGQHLLTLINDVLDLSKIEAGRMEVVSAPTDLHQLLKGVYDIVAPRAEVKGLDFTLDVSPEVPRGVHADATKLRQILVNLLGNAVKFTAKGSVDLHVREDVNHDLEFRITDTGIGMTEEEISEVFDPFKQAEGGHASGGTGLGLAISKRLVESMDGVLTVESKYGEGTIFTVTHPLIEAEDEDLAAIEEDSLSAGRDLVLAPGQSFKVLIVDDRQANRDILSKMLTSAGFAIDEACDGIEALERIDETDYDLVLMDVRMPRLNGIDATARVREDPRHEGLVIFAVTASVFPEFRVRAREAGFDDFLGKPFRLAELFQRIETHLGAKFESRSGAIETPAERAPSQRQASESRPDQTVHVDGEVLARLSDALRVRNVTALNAIIADLATRPGCAPIADRMGAMARGFDFGGLERLIEALLAKPSA
ncbi:MAG: ATP-binding protein, partial [Planctomycetota bacterium]